MVDTKTQNCVHRVSKRVASVITALVLGTVALSSVSPAFAHTPVTPGSAGIAPPPLRRAVDNNDVDVFSGDFIVRAPTISIGGLTYAPYYDSSVHWFRDNWEGAINSSGSLYSVTLLGEVMTFTLSSGVYSPAEGKSQGAALTYNSTSHNYTLTTRDGSIATFSKDLAGAAPVNANEGRLTSVVAPSGYTITLTYTSVNSTTQKLQSVNDNRGYQLKYEYTYSSDAAAVTRVRAINNAVEYCSPSASTCSLSGAWPDIQIDYTGAGIGDWFTVSFMDNNDPTEYTTDFEFYVPSGSPTQPELRTKDFLTGVAYSSGRVTALTRGSDNWSYAYSDASGQRTTTITDPQSHNRVVVSNIAARLMLSDADDLGHTTSYTYDSANRVTSVEAELGNHADYTYDSRGNVTQTTLVPKSGSGLSNIVTSASYSSTCSNPVVCNQPNSTTDARSKVTDYTYDSTHGGLLTATAPAPSSGAVRPQTRIAYTQLYAYYKNSSGTIVAAATPIYLPTSSSACATTSSCSGGADEVKTSTTYGSTGVANNLLPTSVTTGAGDNTLLATTTTTYNNRGQPLTIDGPLSGSTDTVNYLYDAMGRVQAVITPDPDGGGSLKYRATIYDYDEVGDVASTRVGSTTSANSVTGWTALYVSHTLYDDQWRPQFQWSDASETGSASGRAGALTQYGYDSAGRLECVAARGNAALDHGTYSSIAACDLGPDGIDGPDRITKNIYDSAGRVTQIKVALHTAREATITKTYSDNDLLLTLTDERSFKTTYTYDGFDRLIKTQYPNPSSTGSSSTTDYEETTYSSTGQVSQTRNRYAGVTPETFTPTYDDLGRVTHMDAPGTADDADYTYDNFGRTLSVATGQTLSFSYDALSRTTSATGPLGTVSYDYDLAGRRTKMTWPDSFYVNYDYDAAGALTKIRENGATSGAGVLATYAYDDLGRRTSLTRGNGVVTTYTVNANSQLTSLAQDLSGTTNDVSVAFTYGGFGQFKSRSASNAAYDPAMPSTADTSYARNGLNQYTAIGLTGGSAASYSYDDRGNLTSDGTHSYSYDAFNRLTSSGSVTLSYDPLGRLYQTSASVTTKLQYDGADLIGEYNSSNALLRRYVHGPGTDEPIVWYEGSGTSDRRWLVSDERGSVMAVTDSSGATIAKNTYDEYGKPGSGNVGRFQYTGQTWLSDLSLYYYKARLYSASLGRFMQPDPIGYDGGLNIYAYVSDDPISGSDPSGLDGVYCTGTFIAQDEGSTCDFVNGLDAISLWIEIPPPTIAWTPTGFHDPNTGTTAYFDGRVVSEDRGLNEDIVIAGQSSGELRGALYFQTAWPSNVPAEGCSAAPIACVFGMAAGLSGDTPKRQYLLHYTGVAGKIGIPKAGYIRPSANGSVYLTKDVYFDAETAQRMLALPSKPTGFFSIPAENVGHYGPFTTVTPAYGQPGGGLEMRVPFAVSVKGAVWIPLPLPTQ